MATCIGCGGRFPQRNANHRYCTKNCGDKARSKQRYWKPGGRREVMQMQQTSTASTVGSCTQCGLLFQRKTAHTRRCPSCVARFPRRKRSYPKAPASQRGYGREHQQLRKRWAARMQTELILCAKCGLEIWPGQRWDLGHTTDRTAYTGPEHAFCNRSAGARKRERLRRERLGFSPEPTSRTW